MINLDSLPEDERKKTIDILIREYKENGTFSDDDMIELIKKGISLEEAMPYRPRFDGVDIGELLDDNIGPETAFEYHERFNGFEISELISAECPPEIARKYPKKITLGIFVAEMFAEGVTPEDVEEYPERFDEYEIAVMAGKVRGLVAEKYSPLFNGWDISFLAKKRIGYAKANGYAEHYTGREVALLVKKGVSASLAEEYKFMPAEKIVKLIKSGIKPGQVTSYDSRLSAEALIKAANGNWSPAKAKKWREFGAGQRQILREGNVPLKKAREYPKRFCASDIALFVKEGLSPEFVRGFHWRLNGRDVVALVKQGFNQEQTKGYHRNFHSDSLRMVIEKGYLPERANMYFDEWSRIDGSYVIRAGVPPEMAVQYVKRFEDPSVYGGDESRTLRFNGIGVSALYKSGIYPETFDDKQISKLSHLIGASSTLLSFREDDAEFKFIGCGSSSIIMLAGGVGIKLTDVAEHESNMLGKIESCHKGRQKNLIKKLERWEVDYSVRQPMRSIELDEEESDIKISFFVKYIQGDTLGNIVSQGKLNTKKVLKYASGIMNGLVEMRQAGIWHHRDIRPGNIMVDKKKGLAVIIDLGLATEDKYALQVDNRRFGAPKGKDSKGKLFLANDLVSLGQVMYYMATGTHLFDKSESMGRSLEVADEIADYRFKLYAGLADESLDDYLSIVDKKVGGEVGDLIKSCLKAGNDDLDKVHEMFRRYAA